MWYTNCFDLGKLCDLLNYVHIFDINAKVVDVWNGDSWDLSRLATPLPQAISDHIMSISPPQGGRRDDGRCWTNASSRVYSTYNAYKWLLN